MIDRILNARKSDPGEKPLPRKTTEVRLDQISSAQEAVARAHTVEPALVMLQGDLPGSVFRLRPGRQIIGRRPECDIRLRERAVSGIHAEITRSHNSVTINDLASTNGTMVDGAKIKAPVALTQGSLLKLGNCVFKYVDSLLEVEFTESLHTRGITDQLTGAYNKSYLLARLAFIIDTAGESRPVSVITFDFDNFKHINDDHGHAAGDHVLRATSAMISANFVRAGDLFARMGGEEFVIILPDTPLPIATEIAEGLRRTLEERTFEYHGHFISLTSSFGVCTATSGVEQPEALLSRADELLYKSKREGRNRVTA